MGVPYTFGTATTSIPLSQLDANFNTPVTLGNTTVGLGNTVTTVGNLTLTNVNITSGTINSAVVVESYALANAVVYSDASKDGTTSANLTFNGTTFTAVNDASISGLTVGKGGGAASTNTAIGASALNVNTTGIANTALGYNALIANTSGTDNVVIGTSAGLTNTTGNSSVAIGRSAMRLNTTGGNNIGIGYQALYSNTTASNNTAVGYQAGYSNTTGSSNVALGTQALFTNTTGQLNVAVGHQALYAQNADAYNTAVGSSSMVATTSGAYNAALGRLSLQANTTGSNNSAFGYQALNSNTTASYNTAVGYQALYSNVTGIRQTAVGYQAGNACLSNESTYIGFQAGVVSTGAFNTIIGAYAGYGLTTGTANTFVGPSGVYGSGQAMTTGSKNTIIGAYSGNNGGLDIRTADNYIVLSDGDGNPRQIINGSGYFGIGTNPVSNAKIYTVASANQWVGYFEATNASMTDGCVAMVASRNTTNGTYKAMVYYNSGAAADRFYVIDSGAIYSTSTSISAISDQRQKENIRDLETGLNEVMALKPRRFDWKEGKGENKKNVAGFVAQEVETVLPELISTWQNSQGDDQTEYKALAMGNMIPTLVKAIQELKAEVDSLKAQLNK